jgi:Leucine-rich repeat (LRR) protein
MSIKDILSNLNTPKKALLGLTLKFARIFAFMILGINLFGQTGLITPKELSTKKIYNSLEDALKDPDNVYLINLGYFELSYLPKDIVKLKKVQYLSFEGNELKNLSDDLLKLENLQYIDLSYNPKLDIVQTFKLLSKLPNLISVRLAGNGIGKLPAELGKLTKLEILDIQDNSLSRLPRDLFTLKSLRILNIANNHLFEVPREISNLSSLQNLNLSMNRLTKLPMEFSGLANLEELDLSFNRISKIPAFFEKLTKLQNLEIRKNKGLSINKEEFLKMLPNTKVKY